MLELFFEQWSNEESLGAALYYIFDGHDQSGLIQKVALSSIKKINHVDGNNFFTITQNSTTPDFN